MRVEFKNVVITGGAGYCGSRLVPQLISQGYNVTVYDTLFFGHDFLPQESENFHLVQGDIRDTQKLKQVFHGNDAVVNLACISNDASFELDESLSTSVNLDAFEPMVLAAKSAGVKRFIYASSSSVYGVSDQKNVTEEHPLLPLTLYNKYKGVCEPILKKHTDEKFTGLIFRPATVCGYSPNMRLDLSVNILTSLAINKRQISVFGGTQMRPNLHIQDYCDVVNIFLSADSKLIQNEVFNVGYQNLTINEIALMVKNIVELEIPGSPIDIVTTRSDDNRSYHINSDKIARILGFKPKYSIEQAILEICHAFREGKIPNSLEDEKYYRVKKLKRIQAK